MNFGGDCSPYFKRRKREEWSDLNVNCLSFQYQICGVHLIENLHGYRSQKIEMKLKKYTQISKVNLPQA